MNVSQCSLTAANFTSKLSLFTDAIFGEVLFWSLKKCLGSDVYDTVAHFGWIKIFSKMLTVIVPVVVAFEMSNKEIINNGQMKRMKVIIPQSDIVILAGDLEKSVTVNADHCCGGTPNSTLRENNMAHSPKTDQHISPATLVCPHF